MLSVLQKNDWLAAGLLAALLVLFILVAFEPSPGFSRPPLLKLRPGPPPELAPVRKMEALFAPDKLAAPLPATNLVNLFYTAFYQPPPPPPPPPPPQAITTRKVELTYQGLYQTAEGQRQAFIRVDTNLVIGAVGARIVADLAVAEIGLRTLAITNGSARTNVLQFNIKTPLDIPTP